MKTYLIVISTSPDHHNSCIAGVPDLEGCMAAGNTVEEAFINAQSAIDAWIEEATKEGREIPALKQHKFYTPFSKSHPQPINQSGLEDIV